jgi:hypothetical protein
MGKAAEQPKEAAIAKLLAPYSPAVQDLTRHVRAMVRGIVPDADEEIDAAAKMLVETFIPGTYKGAILAIVPQKNYVNIIFSKGVELLEVDSRGLLEGTGKLARHIKIRSPEQVDDPAVRTVIEAAVARTPRSR